MAVERELFPEHNDAFQHQMHRHPAKNLARGYRIPLLPVWKPFVVSPSTDDTSYPVIIMAEKKGHFDKGVWVDDPVPAPAQEQHPIDVRLANATKSVVSAMDEFAKATRDLVATEEGKKHIENTVRDTTAHVQKSFDDILAKAKAETEKVKAEIAKSSAPKK